jgi:hypothetical protein
VSFDTKAASYLRNGFAVILRCELLRASKDVDGVLAAILRDARTGQRKGAARSALLRMTMTPVVTA